MCDKSGDEINGQRSGDFNDSSHKTDEEEDEDIDEEESDESDEEEVTEGEDNTEENGGEINAIDEDLEESGSDDDTEVDEETDDEIENQALNGGQSPRDGSDAQCYICLNRFSGQDIGSPESCADLHYFCLDCIEEWSKQINTCPVDRKIFTYIVVRREIGSTVIMKLPIVKNVVPDIEAVPEDVTYCEICGRCDREDRLLLCDGCDFGYHCECLSPPIENIPIEEWFCPDCYHRLFGPDTSTAIRTGGAGPSALQRRRAIARTGASEAVRQRILQRRTQRTKKPVRRKTTKRRRKTTRRKKTTTKRKKTTTSGTKIKRRRRRTKKRRKKRTRKSAFASRRLPAPTDPRARIVSKLGIGPPPKSPFGLPSMKNVSNEAVRRLIETRAAAGISNLSLFGTELDVYDPRVQTFDEDEDDLMSTSEGGVGLMARSRIGRLIGSPVKRKSELIENLANNELTNSSSIDLLSQIMSSQKILHSSSRDVRIARDGTLHFNSAGLPVRSCGNSGQSSPARSPTTSSPAKSPPSNSPQRTDNSAAAQNSSFNYSFGSASNNRTNSSGNDSDYPFNEDISAVKPVLSPVEELRPSDESKVELYSDIESVGDNTRDNNNSESDGEEDVDNKQLLITTDDQSLEEKISETNEQKSDAIEPQCSDNCDKSDNTLNKTEGTANSLDNNNNSNERTQSVDKSSDKTPKKLVQTPKKSRKPSIKDLFGDSSDEEEDDSDIRRLLAEQGSINVHYPIKMSIVLKNSIAKKETINDNIDANNTSEKKSDEKQTSLQIMDSQPAPDLSKWVVVPPKDGTPAPDSTTTSNKGINKWKSIESTDSNPVIASVEAISAEPNEGSDKWKPIKTVDVTEPTSAPEDLQSKVQNLITNKTIDVDITESELKSNDEPTSDPSLPTAIDPLSTTGADEEEGEIKDDDQKVRRCRHGRIRREKAKEKEQRAESSKGSRHRSRSCDSKHRHKPKDKEMGNKDIDCDVNSSDVNVDNESSLPENVEFKEKTFERKDKELEEPDNSESVGWKKLSNSSKMRSYRDGKPKDEEILFREREPPKKLVKKPVSTKTKPKDGAKEQLERHTGHESRQKSSDARRQQIGEMSAPSEETKRKHRSETDKSEDNRRHKRKSDESMAKHKRRVDENTGRSSSSRRSPAVDEYNTPQDSKERHKRHHKSSRHKRRDSSGYKESSDRVVSGGDHSHRSHRSSKHSHHLSKSKGGLEGDMWATGAPQKILRDHSSYSDITPLDSKEIYAEGDRIVINVNFNREKSKKPMDSTSNEESNYGNKQSFDDSLDTRKSSISESKARASSKKDDSIFWASPPPTNTSTSVSNQSTSQMTTTIPKIDDDMSSNHSNRSISSGSDRKISETETKKDSKAIEELRLLPRSLHQSDVRPIDRTSDPMERPMGPHTPEGDYNEDQFMPTPTQDESQSPVRSPSMSASSRSSPLSIRSSPLSPTNSSKDDVYDPEAPLQSPDSHQSKANSRRSDPKSPDVIVNSRQSSKRSPQQLPRRQTSSHDSKSRHSDDRRESIPKSSPMTSTTHSVSNRSPFKSNPVPTQRQQSKPSPQKTAQPQHKSSSSLMPPPSAPTTRPSSATSIALTAATIASINPQNLAQLLQMAHALNAKRQASVQTQHQHRSSSGRASTATNNSQNNSNNRDHSKDHNEVVDMDVESPSPPGPQQPIQSSGAPQQPRVTSTTGPTTTAQVKTLWEQIIKTTTQPKPGISGQKRVNTSSNSSNAVPMKKGRPDPNAVAKDRHPSHQHRHQVVSVASDNKKQLNTSGNKLDQLTVLDDVPSSAVEMAVKEKFIKKLNRQERVIEEVKLVLKPYYQKRTVTKEEYKEILRKSVPKICHSRSGEINPVKIKSLIDGYIKRFKHLRKKSVKLPKK